MPHCQQQRMPRYQHQRMPRCQQQRMPQYQQQRMPRCQQQRMPQYQQQRMPRCQQQRMPRYQQQRMPRYQQQRMPRYQQQRMPRYQQQRMPRSQHQRMPQYQQAYVDNFKVQSRKITDEVRGEALLPTGVLCPGQITKPVPLLITKVRQILDDEWKIHRNQREDLQRMYTPEGSILIEELFDVAKQVAQQEADKKCNTPEAKAKHVARYGNIVWVVGLPGVGKSTLLKQMINCIVVDKTVKPDTEIFFHVSLKNFNPKKKVSLLEFLLYGNLSEWNHSDEENKALVHFLYNNPNVVILIDGWDELYTKQANKKLHACQLDSKQIPEVFVKNLLMGNFLPKAAKVITSRPGPFYELHSDYRQGLVSEVRGIDKPAKKDLTKQICGEANLENVEKLLAERPNLDALCSIPVYCIQIVACLHSSVSSGRDIHSMTDVFIHTLTNYKASDHVRTNMSERDIGQELVKLAHLAYKGLAARKLVFQQADFEEVGINEQTVDMFLHTYVEKSHHLKMRILEGKKRSFFTHLTWHEFFAAVYLMLFMSQEEFRRCMDIFKDPHWVMVTRFMFGICNSTSYEDLKMIFPASMIKDYKEKKNILKYLISLEVNIKKDVIKLSGWVHEANDAEISQGFQERMPQDIFTLVKYPTEASDVAFAFNNFTTPHDLNLSIKSLDKASTETLLRVLHESQAKVKLKICFIE
ncbi:NACHT, LRR and PYD domains-containing protein 3-like [Ciona intestinalis]